MDKNFAPELPNNSSKALESNTFLPQQTNSPAEDKHKTIAKYQSILSGPSQWSDPSPYSLPSSSHSKICDAPFHNTRSQLKYNLDPMSGHLSLPQPGGGITEKESDTEDEDTNRHINANFDEKCKIIFNAGRLLTQPEQKFTQNHWKITPPHKIHLSLAQ
jgi:hypothetical protein